MKKFTQFSFLLLFLCDSLLAQNISINATGALAHPSAMLDISSTTKGFLMPRMSSSQRLAIGAPAEGLKVYDTDTKTFWFYNGSGWTQLSTGSATNYWNSNGTGIFNNNAGSVAIGNPNPGTNKLEIGIAPGFLNNDLAIGNGTGGMSFLQTSSASIWYTNKNFALMPASGPAWLGINTTSPLSLLSLYTDDNTDGFTHKSAGGIVVTERVGGVSGSIGTSSNHTFRLVANNAAVISIDPAGNTGVGVIDQQFKMDIASQIRIRTGGPSAPAGVWLNDMNNASIIAFMGVADNNHAGWYSGNAGWGMTMNTDNGNIGIGGGSITAANKLQVGSVGATGFATNDFAIGNGTNALGILQTNSATYFGATTDIVLMPRNNGHGRVGINTTTPRAALDIADFDNAASSYAYFDRGGYVQGFRDCNDCMASASIVVNNAVLAKEFDAFSDARIKLVEGTSSSAADLGILNALQVTNYTMKDVVSYGTKKFKKVIAQQVESVYPQVVSRHTDFIPNVYKASSAVEKSKGGYLLSFSSPHNITATAKKLRVLLSETGNMEVLNIISVPSASQVIIDAPSIPSGKVFVYGEEVDDFRTVDYEGLTTLTMSATQELSKLLKKQQAIIKGLEKRIRSLEGGKQTNHTVPYRRN